MLPYLSYLRVYEPLHALSETVRAQLPADLDADGEAGHTLATEQHTALTSAVMPRGPLLENGRVPSCYVLRRQGHSYFCPTDMPLRSWLSLTSLLETVGGATAQLWLSADTIATADEAFLAWRQQHPSAVPHIRQTTWGIPRTWFVLVAEDEREAYTAGGHRTVRYRTRAVDARRRLASAHSILRKVIDEAELLAELRELSEWLEAFDSASWLELDYAGIARLLGDALPTDQSARDIHRALAALRSGDFTTAAASYRDFEARWRVVNAYERAN